jgi:hypothetical protein
MRWSSTPRSRSSAPALAAALAALWLVAGPSARAAAPPAAAEFAAIASGGVPVDGLTLEELRRVFLFKRGVWRPGQPVYVMLPDRGLPARAFLLRHVYRMSDQDLRRFILERIFQAEIDFAPKVVGSEQEALAFVKAGRSIITLVSAAAPRLSEVKVLRIDGKLPRQAGYPLVDR